MTGPSVPQGTGGTLVERLTETLGEHYRESWLCDCVLGPHTEWADECDCGTNIAREGLAAHLADVAAQTVAAWVREQEEAVALGLAAKEWRESPRSAHAEHNFDGGCEICSGNTDAIAAAALGVLREGLT